MCMENTIGQAQNVQVPNYSGVNIQIFNPSVAAPGGTVPASNINTTNYNTNPAPSYPGNYYTQNFAQPAPVTPPTALQPQPVQEAKVQETSSKKTEKREIVQLTDEYIKTLEEYLNSQDKQVRLLGAKEVFARFDEDHSRKNDVALNALLDKMLQDPSPSVNMIGMTTLEAKVANGTDKTAELVKKVQQKQTPHGFDSLQASSALLKMSGTTTEKEFEVTAKDLQKRQRAEQKG